MKTISLVCQKGGTGKTTLALCLAVEAVARGLAVAVIDLDPQVSACTWSDMRADQENPAVAATQPGRLPKVLATAREGGVDLAIIDTAGRTEEAAHAAASSADLVLVPLQPSVIDLKTVAATLNLIKRSNDPQALAVLTRVKPYGTRHMETRQWLEEQGLGVCPATLGDRVTFQDAYAQGLSVGEAEPGGKAAQEIQEVYLYISKLLDLPNRRKAINGEKTKHSKRAA